FLTGHTQTFKRGDLNDDGLINAFDFALLKKYLLTGESNNLNLKAADADADGKVDARDLARLKNYLLGRITSL
ncbi:MAG TPA: dockerin type I domain-containing protein, partial [Ruminiclostridium sp.]|nr:dockerin type I domain-containing protein [Ruminiclostridium sp.]